MHFSIPDTTDIIDSRNNNYTLYNIQINGVYHCSLRYSQLHNFNANLKKEFDSNILPPFPPKRLFSLSTSQIEERRLELERYIQQISQCPQILSSETFTDFFLNAQKESLQEKDEDVNLDIYSPSGKKVVVAVRSLDKTLLVYQAAAAKMSLPEKSQPYFALYLILKSSPNSFAVIRKMQGFESPYISMKATLNLQGRYFLCIRKAYWDPCYDEDLLDDRISLNLLYTQAQCDKENGWLELNDEQSQRLAYFDKQGSKKEFLKYARNLKYYNHMFTNLCMSDYPRPCTPVVVAIGPKEILLKLQTESGIKEVELKVTRIRCWRIASVVSVFLIIRTSINIRPLGPKTLELSLEYLISKNTLKWISIYSPQAIFISMCLQSVVDELIMKKNGEHINKSLNKLLKKSISKEKSPPIESTFLNPELYFTGNSAFDDIRDDDL
ncbi:hypothetical protein HELRODRAFT_97472 [Helobdella robusta]|uniref:PX domain-containing protein n=1 Tax=Helobdella robusta TaxID=6412 RepID=T1G9G8_HELRO|nr:hypothetical protein HELRODRAFT_97472 [Helobdella robusta]ESO09292.1 hypothetical protein HELRODRAFT_97472 [Helobdella robusta]